MQFVSEVWLCRASSLLGLTRPQPMPDDVRCRATVLDHSVSDTLTVSGLLQTPERARACMVLGHGAGAGMTHPYMTAISDGLAARGIMSLRYQFPFMERGGRRPDPPALAHSTVRAAVAQAVSVAMSLPLLAGGKSFGGRMTSQAQAAAALPGVAGLVFFGFPLHPAGRPSTDRANHLSAVRVPMLFLQGSRDALAETGLLVATVEALGPAATLHLVDGADHAFAVPARQGTGPSQTLADMLDAFDAWMSRLSLVPRS